MKKLAGIGWGVALASGLALGACSSGGDDESGQPAGGAAGTGGSSAGTTGKGGTSGKGGSAGSTSGGSTSGGGGKGGASSGSGGTPDEGGSGPVDEGGAGGDGPTTEPCTPASTEGIDYSGTCTYEDSCSEQYDVTFTVEQLQQICEGQSGTWSQTPCEPSAWDITCTQEFAGGVYIQFLPSDGICVAGCEQPL